jgi:hypothetical protein
MQTKVSLLLLFLRQGLTISPGWPQTCYVAKAGLQLAILLPQLLSAGTTDVY